MAIKLGIDSASDSQYQQGIQEKPLEYQENAQEDKQSF